ncbi:MAG: YaiI/YqxD family protein [Fuerstiella sp.]
MHIWIDADACPSEAKDVLFKAARQIGLRVTLVANQPLYFPKSDLISFELVKAGADAADQRIVELLAEGDLVVTADIPLAGDAIEKGAHVIDPRGDLLNKHNIGSRLSTRNFLADFRAAGGQIPGPPPYSAKDKRNFANQLDKLLTKLLRADRRSGPEDSY